MRASSLLLWCSIIKQRCKSWREATRAYHRNTAGIGPHLVAMHQRVAQRGKVNPVIRMQMGDPYDADLRECTNADVCSEWCVRAVSKIQHDCCDAMLHQVSRRARAIVGAIRARRTENDQR